MEVAGLQSLPQSNLFYHSVINPSLSRLIGMQLMSLNEEELGQNDTKVSLNLQINEHTKSVTAKQLGLYHRAYVRIENGL